jgi:tRNA/rRNA methyltransferase
VHIGYLDPAAPKKLMPRLNALLNRAALRDEEIHILRGVAKAMLLAQPQQHTAAPAVSAASQSPAPARSNVPLAPISD